MGNKTVGREMLAEIKAVEKLFYGDETDLMKVDTITEEQVDITNDVISSINEACNKTDTFLQKEQALGSNGTESATHQSSSLMSSSSSYIDASVTSLSSVPLDERTETEV